MALFSKRFVFRDAKCIGRECFRPEERILPPGKVSYGINLRRLQRKTWVCGHCKDFGCPVQETFSQELAQERIDAGWQSSRI